MNIIEKLSAIQQEISVPKSLYNSYSNFYYRNAEGILEAVKPLEKKYKVMFIVEDQLEQIGERYYVKATAKVYDTEYEGVSIHYISASAYAREVETKKGMDGSQITGTASSYARKYALNGLLLLDDAKDADTNEYTQTDASLQFIDKNKIKSLKNELKRVGKTEEDALRYCHVSQFEDITLAGYMEMMDSMSKAPDKKEELPFK